MSQDLQAQQQIKVLRALLCYALIERKQETQLSTSFAILVQERHNQFHTKGDRKTGDGTDFSECSNDLCRSAFAILKDSRSMSVEINDFTLAMIGDYDLKIEKVGMSCRAVCQAKSQVQIPEPIQRTSNDSQAT